MAENEPTVSVVITAYNYGRYVSKAIESVLNQTVRDLECIVVDDGSTDDTPSVVSRFTQDRRLRYVRQNRRGQAGAKNSGVRESVGKYVAFLDADDWWENRKLDRQMPLFRNGDVSVVYSKMELVDEDGCSLGRVLPGRIWRGRVPGLLLEENFIPFSSAIVRRSCFDKVGGFDETLQMGIDWDLWLRISLKASFDGVDAPLVKYRVGHPGQMSKNEELRVQCSDRIMARFLSQNRHLIDPKAVAKAECTTLCNRGDHYRRRSLKRSTSMFGKAVAKKPTQLRPYKGLVRNVIKWLSSR